MATGDPIDRAYLEIDGVQLSCEDIDIKFDDGTQWVEAMTRDNLPLGVVRGNQKAEVSATVAMREDEEDDIDLIDLYEKKTNVAVSVEFQNGRTISFGKGVVSAPNPSSKHGDKATYKVDLKCWEMTVS
jgi:hypothetical protein